MPKSKLRRIDITSLRNPFSLIRIAKEAQKLNPGESLEFIVGDKETIEDLSSWSSRTGNPVDIRREGNLWVVRVSKVG
jgi:TusA-related sulfurtransferase